MLRIERTRTKNRYSTLQFVVWLIWRWESTDQRQKLHRGRTQVGHGYSSARTQVGHVHSWDTDTGGTRTQVEKKRNFIKMIIIILF